MSMLIAIGITLVVGNWQPEADAMRQLFPDTWALGEEVAPDDWRRIKMPDTTLRSCWRMIYGRPEWVC